MLLYSISKPYGIATPANRSDSTLSVLKLFKKKHRAGAEKFLQQFFLQRKNTGSLKCEDRSHTTLRLWSLSFVWDTRIFTIYIFRLLSSTLFYFYLETNKQKIPDSLLFFNRKLKSYLTIKRKKTLLFFPRNPELSLVPTSTRTILSLDLHLEENIHFC